MTPNPTSIILIATLIFSAVGILLLGLYTFFVRGSTVSDRITQYIEPEPGAASGQAAPSRDRLSRVRYRLNSALSLFASPKITLKLLSANWPISVVEFVLMRFSVAGLALILGWLLTRNILGGILMAIVVYMVPGFFLYRSISLRQKKFQNQLIDVLVLIRGAVQAGYSLLQALEVVINELPNPASEEFSRMQREVQLGLPLSQALQNLGARMESDDLDLVVTAIVINSQVGGNLSVMLTAVTETIRNRIYLFGEIRAMTSYARYTSYLLTMLPFLTGLLIFLISPTYFDDAWVEPMTRLIFIAALIGIFIGNIWLRRIANIKV